jgi:hypothetical protein
MPNIVIYEQVIDVSCFLVAGLAIDDSAEPDARSAKSGMSRAPIGRPGFRASAGIRETTANRWRP